MPFNEAAWFSQGEQENARLQLQQSWQETGSLDVEGIPNEVKMEFAQGKMEAVNNAIEALVNEDLADDKQTAAVMEKVAKLNEQKQALETIYAQYADPVKERERREAFLQELYPGEAPTPLHPKTGESQPLDLSDLLRFLKTSQQTADSWKQMAEKADDMGEEFSQAHQAWINWEQKREQIYDHLPEQMKRSLSEVGIESEQKIAAVIDSLKSIMGDKAFEQVDLYA